MRGLRYIVLTTVLLLNQACSSDSAYILKPQVWRGIEVAVEVRPRVPRTGMNEFLVVATQEKNKRPAYDLIVSLKTKDTGRWEQSIQDGDSGVYRRAVWVQDPSHDVLLVLLQQGDIRGELHFPLTLTTSDSPHQSQK